MQPAPRIQGINCIQTLSNDTVLVDHGPMRMFISVFDNGKPLIDLAREGGYLALKVLEDLANFLPVIKRKTRAIEIREFFPDVVRKMIEATWEMDEPDLTPLAAVAGAASDVVADFLISQGGTKVIVDNGGDIAIRLKGEEVVRVGVKAEIEARNPAYVIPLDIAAKIGGVATSGLGGRSFTKGIASAATVLAKDAALADAAATVIGNFTNVEDPRISRSLAEKIYPDTDIPGEWVTVHVGSLSQEKIDEALMKGLSKANSLRENELIQGALIAVQGKIVWTESIDPFIVKL